ncbi:hypothetical protein LHGZ1_1580 [Laribacter hongkongensis]|jgi:hypothetical protein|uniref:Uncharacterized protein n=1 Tax=Laribacter hongkongensis TaxID=168471 RepID=A0A248LIV8_9NEIS|nr:hypothetical protein LHGZ1_1580 [Laribacter hongkongensis]
MIIRPILVLPVAKGAHLNPVGRLSKILSDPAGWRQFHSASPSVRTLRLAALPVLHRICRRQPFLFAPPCAVADS